jgi:hypothetical protein
METDEKLMFDFLKDYKLMFKEIASTTIKELFELFKEQLDKQTQVIVTDIDAKQKARIGVFSLGYSLVMIGSFAAFGVGFGLIFFWSEIAKVLDASTVIWTLLGFIVFSVIAPVKMGYSIIIKSLSRIFGKDYLDIFHQIQKQEISKNE